MKPSAPTLFDNALQTTNIWLKELMQELQWEDRHRAYHALRAVLHALRDRLTIGEVADLGAQLPLLIRGMYYEGWKPNTKRAKPRKKEEFLETISHAFPTSREDFPEMIAWAVFKLLQRHVSAGEINDVKHVLPREIAALWPQGKGPVEVAHS